MAMRRPGTRAASTSSARLRFRRAPSTGSAIYADGPAENDHNGATTREHCRPSSGRSPTASRIKQLRYKPGDLSPPGGIRGARRQSAGPSSTGDAKDGSGTRITDVSQACTAEDRDRYPLANAMRHSTRWRIGQREWGGHLQDGRSPCPDRFELSITQKKAACERGQTYSTMQNPPFHAGRFQGLEGRRVTAGVALAVAGRVLGCTRAG